MWEETDSDASINWYELIYSFIIDFMRYLIYTIGLYISRRLSVSPFNFAALSQGIWEQTAHRKLWLSPSSGSWHPGFEESLSARWAFKTCQEICDMSASVGIIRHLCFAPFVSFCLNPSRVSIASMGVQKACWLQLHVLESQSCDMKMRSKLLIS